MANEDEVALRLDVQATKAHKPKRLLTVQNNGDVLLNALDAPETVAVTNESFKGDRVVVILLSEVAKLVKRVAELEAKVVENAKTAAKNRVYG